MSTVQVVWFKKDFRLSDHRCLMYASQKGPILPLYVVEPDYWALKDTSYRQYLFLRGCVEETIEALKALGASVAIASGDVVEILKSLQKTYGDIELWSHQETGNDWTFQRDKAVRNWCRQAGVAFHEPLQFGVWRGSKIDRDNWAKQWDALMAEPMVSLPKDISFVEHSENKTMPSPEALGLEQDGITTLQPPGRNAGLKVLNSFLYERGEKYRTDMSSPVTGESGCSRLSPYLAYGTISMRETYQATQKRIAEVAAMPKAEKGTWAGSLSSFVGRLHWHCHFTQKLELEPELEWLPMARAYTGIRDDGDDIAKLKAFAAGQTGYPFVDACMRYLRATGWINFRMRAMLMSFASYDLWLPWQKSGDVLARLFTDYEPGIHWPQSQMQSGVTGINAIRIYSPIKQGIDQDPEGLFTRQWVPELATLPDKVLQTPWLSDIELSYPSPIVEHKEAAAQAKSRLWAIKKTPEAKEEAEKVYEKHGSRKKPRRRTSSKKTAAKKAKADKRTKTKRTAAQKNAQKSAQKTAKKAAQETADVS
ncbi:cryptochrome/deoxyribodipyrimidine photo-lyase family protein [cf. Phormidesmis sp. LEGE 11477]|uniref:cryptochrome/deoxyribodipyrimidine photo-lyase family protein n=1 Tax=cf. Phormidesmis sp. LEGE 11477 TaxID=1828680 RepID=UPI00187EEEAA|nr:FAD-binding domain-containing protein [cf. Phormidesmis sp. LEGE 11477]MBE9062467.1 deoxyribodipyrimidine photo-lyase [cf. Phormidesmis sp. LEGE 11477]